MSKGVPISRRIFGFVVYHPLPVILLVVIASFYFAVPIPHVDFSASSDTLMVKDDPDQLFFDKVKRIFGDDQISVICVIAPEGIYNKRVFDTLEWMTKKLEEIDGVDEVVSLINIRNISGEHVKAVYEINGKVFTYDENRLETGELVKKIPETDEEWEELKKKIGENPLYYKNIVSEDGKATSINVVLDTMSEEELYSRDIVGQIEAIMAEARKSGLDISATGIPQTKVATSNYMKEDLKRFLPYTILFIAIALYLNFYQGRKRLNPAFLATVIVSVASLLAQVYLGFELPFGVSLLASAGIVLFLALFGGQAIILPLLAVIITVIWTVGFMGYLNIKFSLVSTVLPSLLITIGIAYVIHVMSEYYHEKSAHGDPREALIDAVHHISLAVFVTAFTTAVGFASLIISKIPAIRDMGILAVFGVTVAFVLSLTFIPSMIALSRHAPGGRVSMAQTNDTAKTDRLSIFLRNLGDWDMRNAKWIIGLIIFLSLSVGYGARNLTVDTDFMSYFHREDPIVKARDKLISHLAGSAPFFVVIDARIPKAFYEPKILAKVEQFQKWLSEQEGVDTTISVVDYLKLTNRAEHGNDEKFFTIPDPHDVVARMIDVSLSGTGMLDPYLNKERSMANIMIRTRIVGSSTTLALERKIKEWAEKNFTEAKITMTGTLLLLNKTADKVSRSQTESTITAIFSIFLVMSLLLMSFKMGLLAMIPNVFPIVMLFGIMGYSGITINLSTSIIASIIIGLAVDDTIHLLSQFNYNVKELKDEREAIRATLATTGRPVFLTSVTLFLGFSVVSFSKFQPIFHFGILTACTLLICASGDLFMLPSILRYVKIITLWELLDMKLGKDPKKKIKIFEGLSNRQARIAALMGKIQSFAKDSLIIQEGDVGEEMFVVIRGKVEIYAGDWDSRMSIAILGPGDNFGEMAVVRHGFRSASARAMEDTELLILDAKSLYRIQKRYPRIASAIFLNLTRILSDRLQITTVTAMMREKH